MIKRATDAGFINRVLNDSAVRPDVADLGEGELDVSAIVANPNNVCLVGEHGCFVCLGVYFGGYEVHTAVLPSGRGKWTAEFAKAGTQFMFTRTNATEILTRVPEGHIAALALTQKTGFRQQFTTPPECLFRGKRVRASVWSLTLQDWALRQPEDKGAALHDWMNSHIAGEPHDPDPDHNRIVGIALDMVIGGQAQKAVTWYNRWAFAARHPLITLESIDPPKIRFDAGTLSLSKGQLVLEPLQ